MDTTAQNISGQLQFVDEWVTVKWGNKSRAHYESLGYVFTRRWDTFQVPITHLFSGTHEKVNVRCPKCGEVRAVSFRDVVKSGHSVCKRCSDVLDLTGRKFDKLTVIAPSNRRSGRAMVWFCQCDCGKYVYVTSRTLQLPVPHSCGRGPCHFRWNMGMSREERIFHRGKPYYKEWRESVFRRDSFACLKCGYSAGKKLVAHHLDSWDSDKERRFSIDNGATLCKTCHKAFHDTYGYGGNTADQFREWIGNQAREVVGHNDVYAETIGSNAGCRHSSLHLVWRRARTR